MLFKASPTPDSRSPLNHQAETSQTHVLASFELAIDLSDRQEYTEYDTWEQQKKSDAEQYLWENRIALSRKVEREVRDRLQLAAYSKHVRFSLKIQRGSITAVATLFTVGMALVEFVVTYKDFYDGLNLLVDHVQNILGRDVEEVLSAGGGHIAATDVHVRVQDVNQPDLPAVPQRRPAPRFSFSPRTIARNLVRAAGILIVVIYLLSRFPATRSFLGELWPLPNLTHRILYAAEDDRQIRHANFTIANLGVGRAEEVLVNIEVLQPGLTSFRLISQEAYQLLEADLEKGVIRFSLERLAAGAVVEVLVDSAENLFLSDIRFSAVSKSGASQARLPQARSPFIFGLRYVPPGEPLELAASAFTRNLLNTTAVWGKAGQSQGELTWDSFVAVVLKADFLRLLVTGAVIAILVGMIFSGFAFQCAILLEILVLALLFFLPFHVPANLFVFTLFLFALFPLTMYYVIAQERGRLEFQWRSFRQWPYLNYPALMVLTTFLLLSASLMLFLAVYRDTQMSIAWLVALVVTAVGGLSTLGEKGVIEELINQI